MQNGNRRALLPRAAIAIRYMSEKSLSLHRLQRLLQVGYNIVNILNAN